MCMVFAHGFHCKTPSYVAICKRLLTDSSLRPPAGCLHPAHQGYFASPADYMRWYQRQGPLRGTDAPTVAILLYRKHVITEQPYIQQLVQCMEANGVRPVPIFINGIEAHTVV